MGLFTYHKWKDFAIEICCSNEKCKSILVIDSRKINGIVFCSQKCGEKEFKE